MQTITVTFHRILFNSAIWDPHHQTLINKLEMMQHQAARFVLNKPFHKSSQHQQSITEKLHHLQWPSLQSRRSTARLILLFKIIRNLLVLPNRCQPQLTNLSGILSCQQLTEICSATI